MTKAKTTKRALLLSVLSMMLCMAMLVGSTFAWFTDSVTSGKNRIVAGNLDVELEYSVDGINWTEVDEATNMFKEGALWEPGYTEVVYLQVKNAGSLALKYQFGINVADKVIGETADGEKIDLAKFIEFGVVEADAAFADRAAARDAVKDTAGLISAGYSSGEGHLTAGKTSNMLALVVYMPEDVGNAANHGTGKPAPEIYMGINLVATQDTVEKDSFGTDYDADAKYPEVAGGDENWYNETATELTISTAAHLVDLAKRVNEGESFEGKTITLANDIALDGASNWVPIGTEGNAFKGTFDGNNKTVSNLFYDQSKNEKLNAAGLFGVIGTATIKNLTVEGKIVASANGNSTYTCGGVCGRAEGVATIENCTNRVTIDCTNVSETFEDQIGVGGILGSALLSSGAKTTIKGCKNEADITVGKEGITAQCFAGGITSLTVGDEVSIDNQCSNTGEVKAFGEMSFANDIVVDLMTLFG